MLRTGAYALCVAIGLGSWGAASAKEHAEEAVFAFGRELEPLADLLGETQVLDLNGERLSISNGLTRESPSSVLDRFQAHCRTYVGPMGEMLSAITKEEATRGLAELRPALLDGVLRDDGRDEGVVLCFARDASSSRGFFEALHRFSESGDLVAFGNVRYAYAKKTPDGDTHVLTAWTSGSFNLTRLVSEDASEPPGSDSPLVPRPRDAQRLLSAQIEGSPFGLRIYKSREPANSIRDAFDATMQGQGWNLADDSHPEGRADEFVRIYQRGATLALVTMTPDRGGAVVSISEMGVQ